MTSATSYAELKMADFHRLTPAMAMKHGFKSVDEYKENVQEKFSLLETGIIRNPSTRLLLVNVSFRFALSGPWLS